MEWALASEWEKVENKMVELKTEYRKIKLALNSYQEEPKMQEILTCTAQEETASKGLGMFAHLDLQCLLLLKVLLSLWILYLPNEYLCFELFDYICVLFFVFVFVLNS